MCGENTPSSFRCSTQPGSPPRVRGKRATCLPFRSFTRITPACAGKTRSGRTTPSARQDHPRVCGENLVALALAGDNLGSPPRVRGKLDPPTQTVQSPRITPACAGKTVIAVAFSKCSWDHPRVCGENTVNTSPGVRRTGSPCVCGENNLSLSSYRPRSGSPPRVRGKLIKHLVQRIAIRITPRVCGENATGTPAKARTMGSPPRVRGKPAGSPPDQIIPGITPACAGKTGRGALGRVADGDHPRVCGENLDSIAFRPSVKGSPPRVRGKRCSGRRGAFRSRITPACAGKTWRVQWSITRRRDHPRVCGENYQDPVLSDFGKGSPPRVRGKP